MIKKIVSAIILTLLLVSILTLAFNIQPVKTQSEGELIFFDDFNDGVADDWTVQLGNFEVIDGEYYTENDLGEKSITTVDDLTFTDCVIEVNLRFRNTEVGFRSGIVFRYTDNAHHYVLYVSAEYTAAEFCMFSPGDTHHGHTIDGVINWSVVIDYNTDYLLRVCIQGDAFTGFLNGQKILSVTDGNYTSGQVGLRAQRSDIFFDNFTVYSIPKTVHVDDDNTSGPWNGTPEHPYQNITSGIEHASAGDTIYVRSGTYYENVVVNKSVSLIGENRSTTCIDGNKTYPPYKALINVTSSNVIVSDFSIENGYYGVCLFYSNNTLISDNLVRNNYHGVLVEHSYFNKIIGNSAVEHHGTAVQLFYSGFNLLRNNTISNCVKGIHVHYGTNHTIDGNFVTTNRDYGSVIYGITLQGPSGGNIIQNNVVSHFRLGIDLQTSRKNMLRNNTMVDNLYNFRVAGDYHICHYIQDVDSSNTVNGRPVYYWIGHHNEQVPSDAGFVGVVNSSNIIVKDLNLTGCGAVLLAHTRHSLIQNVTVSGTLSFSIISCLNNTITNNTVIGRLYLEVSSENTIRNNFVTKSDHGIWVRFSSERNILSENTIVHNGGGICLEESDNNTVCNNLVQLNDGGVNLRRSANNLIHRNTIVSNSIYGIALSEDSYDNAFYHNNLVNNTEQVRLYQSFSNLWDNGCEGNYWSNYNGTDSDGDGIGDTPYVIDGNNTDHYPLMNPYWLPGDVNHDLKINIYDVVRITGVYGSQQGDPNWNCHSDIAEPYGIINIYDVVTCTKDYRKEYTP